MKALLPPIIPAKGSLLLEEAVAVVVFPPKFNPVNPVIKFEDKLWLEEAGVELIIFEVYEVLAPDKLGSSDPRKSNTSLFVGLAKEANLFPLSSISNLSPYG